MARIPEVGDIIDDVFRVEEKLDQGNFGAIYRVHDFVDDRALALKVLKPGPHDEDEVRQRFEREARLIYRLDHPHIVKLRYYGETNKQLPYMAMEFLHGTDLKRLIRADYQFRDDQIQRIGRETLSALEAAHDIGIIHRDLKPANIFLVDDDARGHVKVLDFGFAKSLDDKNDITTTNTLVGSPAYMAPEMVHKDDVGPHSDLYSMGLILGEMVAGHKIVQIENIYDTIVFQASDDPVELPETVRASPFADIIARATSKEIDQRYRSADEMLRDLEALELGGSQEQSEAPTQEREVEPTPLMVDVASDDETAPRARGFPPIHEVDPTDEHDAMDIQGEAAPTQEVNREQLAGIAQQRARGETPRTPTAQHGTQGGGANRAYGGRHRAETPQSRPDQPNQPGRRDGNVQIDMDRPTSSADRRRRPKKQKSSSLLTEIMLGIGLGLVGLALILALWIYL